MFTKELLEERLRENSLVQTRVEILRLAAKMNPKFKNPHIVGGFLRNIVLDVPPRDCDVIFQGYQFNQPGILEAVREAEVKLGIEPFPDWEFENANATGLSGNFYQDNIGKYSYHTDYLTMLMLDSKNNLYIGSEQTLSDLENRIYDLNFPAVYIWATHRGKGRSLESCLTGDLIRAFYLIPVLNLTPSVTADFFMSEFDKIFKSLSPEDQHARQSFWYKKTKGNPLYQPLLDHYNVTSLKIEQIEK